MNEQNGTDVQNEEKGAAAPNQQGKTVEELNAELEKLNKHLEQSRKEEKFSKSELKRLKDELEKATKNDALNELQAKYEAEVEKTNHLQKTIKTKAVKGALEKALTEAKAKSIPTVMKLINLDEVGYENDEVDTKSIEAVIAKLRKEDSVLFDEVETPSVKRAAEGAVAGGFEKEIRSAKTHKEIEEVMRRYGKM